LGDYMMSEKVSVISRWGEEGVDWLRPGPTDKTFFPGIAPYLIPLLAWGSPSNKLWDQQQGPAIKPSRIFNGSYIQGKLTFVDLWNAEASAQSLPYYKPENSGKCGNLFP